ncbi:IucA/IucC family protein [Herbidospora sp. RD11066]
MYIDVAERATVAALLRCCIRELPGQAFPAGPYTMVRVGGVWLRALTSGGAAVRVERPQRLTGSVWEELRSDDLVGLVAREFPGVNGEFAAQVTGSREVIERLLTARAHAKPPTDDWMASEQELVFGHPFHPAPKAREAAKGDWIDYAPEAHARFPLRLLAVREDLVVEEGDVSALDAIPAEVPAGYRLLPVHPWQFELVQPPLGDGRLLDLGWAEHDVLPTSSVRTVYDPLLDKCLKFSLDVRITNCVRKNAWYELSGAVELSKRLAPVFAALRERFPGTRWLPEPGYRTVDLGKELLEGLGVLVRCSPHGRCGPGVTPVLAGALALRDIGGDDPVSWWRAYVEVVALPVLEAYLRHGVVLEPHLQNVLVGLDADDRPVQAVFRDLEGTKLVGHDLAGVPEEVAAAMTYTAEKGWDRVVYCLVVNHLAEIAASLNAPLDTLWGVAAEEISAYGDSIGWPEPLRRLMSGVPLPAKANLTVRWARRADRAATYVPVANPLVTA